MTIANPRYPENHEVNVKKQLSQFVYMLTFTAVNIDRLPDGSQKNDPLVKRVVGLPGEQLMMVDDVLYARTEGEAGYHAVTEDATWARVDLWKEDAARRAKIRSLPIEERGRSLLAAWDLRKNGADPAALASSLRARGGRIEALAASLRGSREPVTTMSITDLRDEAVNGTASRVPPTSPASAPMPRTWPWPWRRSARPWRPPPWPPMPSMGRRGRTARGRSLRERLACPGPPHQGQPACPRGARPRAPRVRQGF